MAKNTEILQEHGILIRLIGLEKRIRFVQDLYQRASGVVRHVLPQRLAVGALALLVQPQPLEEMLPRTRKRADARLAPGQPLLEGLRIQTLHAQGFGGLFKCFLQGEFGRNARPTAFQIGRWQSHGGFHGVRQGCTLSDEAVVLSCEFSSVVVISSEVSSGISITTPSTCTSLEIPSDASPL